MRSIKNAVIFALALSAAPAAWASDSFREAHDDSFSTAFERSGSVTAYALAPDAYDDSGSSARAFDRKSGAASAAPTVYALASDAHDDAGMSSRRLEQDSAIPPTMEDMRVKAAAAQGDSTTPAHQCVDLQRDGTPPLQKHSPPGSPSA